MPLEESKLERGLRPWGGMGEAAMESSPLIHLSSGPSRRRNLAMLVAGMAVMSVVAVCVAVTRLQPQGGRQEVCFPSEITS